MIYFWKVKQRLHDPPPKRWNPISSIILKITFCFSDAFVANVVPDNWPTVLRKTFRFVLNCCKTVMVLDKNQRRCGHKDGIIKTLQLSITKTDTLIP